MVNVARGQTTSCTEPFIDVTFWLNDVPVDVFSLEYIVLDPFDVQVFPLVGRQTVDIAQLCPTGDKLSTGRYVASGWPVAGDAELSPLQHTVRWFYTYTATDLEHSVDTLVDVVDLSSAKSQDLQRLEDFKARFPLLSGKGDELIALALAEASNSVNTLCFGTRAEEAIRYLAAHLLEITTNSGLATGLASVTAGNASISFGSSSSEKDGLDKTLYGRQYKRLMFLSGPGARVIC